MEGCRLAVKLSMPRSRPRKPKWGDLQRSVVDPVAENAVEGKSLQPARRRARPPGQPEDSIDMRVFFILFYPHSLQLRPSRGETHDQVRALEVHLVGRSRPCSCSGPGRAPLHAAAHVRQQLGQLARIGAMIKQPRPTQMEEQAQRRPSRGVAQDKPRGPGARPDRLPLGLKRRDSSKPPDQPGSGFFWQEVDLQERLVADCEVIAGCPDSNERRQAGAIRRRRFIAPRRNRRSPPGKRREQCGPASWPLGSAPLSARNPTASLRAWFLPPDRQRQNRGSAPAVVPGMDPAPGPVAGRAPQLACPGARERSAAQGPAAAWEHARGGGGSQARARDDWPGAPALGRQLLAAGAAGGTRRRLPDPRRTRFSSSSSASRITVSSTRSTGLAVHRASSAAWRPRTSSAAGHAGTGAEYRTPGRNRAAAWRFPAATRRRRIAARRETASARLAGAPPTQARQAVAHRSSTTMRRASASGRSQHSTSGRWTGGAGSRCKRPQPPGEPDGCQKPSERSIPLLLSSAAL